MKIELICTTETLLDSIKNKTSKRNDIAIIYRWALMSSEPTDWKAVNQAIIDRWSINALEYIKKKAWA